MLSQARILFSLGHIAQIGTEALAAPKTVLEPQQRAQTDAALIIQRTSTAISRCLVAITMAANALPLVRFAKKRVAPMPMCTSSK